MNQPVVQPLSHRLKSKAWFWMPSQTTCLSIEIGNSITPSIDNNHNSCCCSIVCCSTGLINPRSLTGRESFEIPCQNRRLHHHHHHHHSSGLPPSGLLLYPPCSHRAFVTQQAFRLNAPSNHFIRSSPQPSQRLTQICIHRIHPRIPARDSMHEERRLHPGWAVIQRSA